MKQKFSKTKKGFSLMELLLVMAIILIATAAIFTNNNDKKAKNEVSLANRKLAAQLRGLQNDATSGKQINGTVVCKYQFTGFAAMLAATTYIDCNSPSNTLVTNNIDLSAMHVTLPNVMYSVEFIAPFGKPSAAKSIKILSNRDASVFGYVCVSSSGNITEGMGDPVPACN